MTASVTHRGSCHCGAVRFEVDAPAELVVHECNCSMCSMTGHLHLIVPEADFRLLAGEDRLVEYRFNTGVARHWFCGRCGVKSFYLPRSNPDGRSVNARCLDSATITSVTVEPFDGANFEANVARLAGLTDRPGD